MKLSTRPLSWFRAHPDNYREHPEAQLAHIEHSLAQFGQYKNVVALPDGTVLAGHGVVGAAMKAGLKALAVQVVDLDEAAARKLMVGDNEVSRLATDDDLQLAELLRSVHYDGGLEGTGFDEESLNELLAEVQTQLPGDCPLEDPGAGEPPEQEVTTCPKCGYMFSGQVAS